MLESLSRESSVGITKFCSFSIDPMDYSNLSIYIYNELSLMLIFAIILREETQHLHQTLYNTS